MLQVHRIWKDHKMLIANQLALHLNFCSLPVGFLEYDIGPNPTYSLIQQCYYVIADLQRAQSLGPKPSTTTGELPLVACFVMEIFYQEIYHVSKWQ